MQAALNFAQVVQIAQLEQVNLDRGGHVPMNMIDHSF
jgi:hypothetical protein